MRSILTGQQLSNMDLQLKNKVIVVTGGANGIGAAIVREAAKEQACPVIVDRDANAAEALVAELQRAGMESYQIACDLSRAENCATAVNETLSHFGQIDALVKLRGHQRPHRP